VLLLFIFEGHRADCPGLARYRVPYCELERGPSSPTGTVTAAAECPGEEEPPVGGPCSPASRVWQISSLSLIMITAGPGPRTVRPGGDFKLVPKE